MVLPPIKTTPKITPHHHHHHKKTAPTENEIFYQARAINRVAPMSAAVGKTRSKVAKLHTVSRVLLPLATGVFTLFYCIAAGYSYFFPDLQFDV